MKVFTMDKPNELDKEYGEKRACKVKLNEHQGFNCILIENPMDSNCIYMVNNIKLNGVRDGNKLWIMVGEEEVCCKHKQEDKVANEGLKVEAQKFNIEFNQNEGKQERLLEVENVIAEGSKELEISSKRWYILLPAGCLYIKSDKPLFSLDVDISWIEEKIDG
ncbi:MAG: hypothetical protein Q8936_08780 [Bacillota bacterium]|nr:hypothetical protein [Bacillota bacterium]